MNEWTVLASNVSACEYRCRMNIPDDALHLKVEHDRRLRGIDDFIAAYEAEHGEITDEQMDAAYRRAKARAVVVRGGHAVDDKGSGAA